MQSSVQYFCLHPAKFKLDGGAMFGIIPRPLWNKVHPSDEFNRIDLALRIQLIKSDNRLILIDTGIGDYHGEKFDNQFAVVGQKNPLKKALESLGHNVDDLTDIVISHMHFDHIGGLGVIESNIMTPVFRNATLHLHKDHNEYAHNPTERDAGSFHLKNFDPVVDWYKSKGQIQWHEGEEGTILSDDQYELKFKCSFGHTPWLMHPYDDQYLYLSDLIPTSNHIHIPWVMGYDIEPGVTTKYKREFLDFVIENDLKVIFEHDPKYWGAKIDRNERGKYIASELYSSSQPLNEALEK